MKTAEKIYNQEPIHLNASLSPEQEKLLDQLREAHTRISQEYPSGAWPWAKETRPDLTWPIEGAVRDLDTAILAGDVETFQGKLLSYATAWRGLFREYSEFIRAARCPRQPA